MKLKTKYGQKEISLDKRYFLARGGEGEIYAKGGLVYKMCLPGKMIPEKKIQELAVLTDPKIIKPEDLLLSGIDPVGYTMKYVKDTYTLCQLFTKAFRLRNNVGPDIVLKLVRQMQETIQFIHQKNILIVDLNELNFLVSDTFTHVFFIDVNSYQTPSFPATAIMDSIRDRHCGNRFNEGTDWFSFAIVSFQMMVGIHPFKGRHPNYSNVKTALDERMKANISVLNKQVTYPQGACQPFSVVPDVYMEWYKAVFESGKRLPPPSDLVTKVKLAKAVQFVAGSNIFNMMQYHRFDRIITHFWYHRGVEVAFLAGGQVSVNRILQPRPSGQMRNVAFTANNTPIACYLDGDQVHLFDLANRQEVPFICNGTRIMDYDGRVYVQNGMNIIEIILSELGSKILASPHVVGTSMENSAVFYPGVVVQRLFDAYYVSLFPQSKICRQYAVRELDDYRVVDAKFDRQVLMVIGVDSQGRYDRFVLRFAKDWKSYDVRKVEDVAFTDLNFVVTDAGVCVSFVEDDKAEIFWAENSKDQIQRYDDPALKGDMILGRNGPKVVYSKGEELFEISVK